MRKGIFVEEHSIVVRCHSGELKGLRESRVSRVEDPLGREEGR